MSEEMAMPTKPAYDTSHEGFAVIRDGTPEGQARALADTLRQVMAERDQARRDLETAQAELGKLRQQRPPTGAWQVSVCIPETIGRDVKDRLFDAIAAAAHDWEPADRDGWDIDVSGHPTPPACPDVRAHRAADLEADDEAGAWYVRLLDEPAERTTEQQAQVDWTHDGRMIGVELLPAIQASGETSAQLPDDVTERVARIYVESVYGPDPQSLIRLIAALHDPRPCDYGVVGCTVHDHIGMDPCPHDTARELLADLSGETRPEVSDGSR